MLIHLRLITHYPLLITVPHNASLDQLPKDDVAQHPSAIGQAHALIVDGEQTVVREAVDQGAMQIDQVDAEAPRKPPTIHPLAR